MIRTSIMAQSCPRCNGAVQTMDRDLRCVNCGWAGETHPPPEKPFPNVRTATSEDSVRSEKKMRENARKQWHKGQARRRAGKG